MTPDELKAHRLSVHMAIGRNIAASRNPANEYERRWSATNVHDICDRYLLEVRTADDGWQIWERGGKRPVFDNIDWKHEVEK